MNFAENLRETASFTYTENGAVALNTTGNACLDLFGMVGGLRDADENRIHTLFAEAYREDPLMATKIGFYARDVIAVKDHTPKEGFSCKRTGCG